MEELYYFRWWSFRKHLVRTPGGFVFTEFLTPVSHAGPFNTVSCAAGFHVAEGRWLHQSQLTRLPFTSAHKQILQHLSS